MTTLLIVGGVIAVAVIVIALCWLRFYAEVKRKKEELEKVLDEIDHEPWGC